MLRHFVWVLMIFTLSTTTVMAQTTDQEKAAVAAAEQWLAVIDAGQYAQSWQDAAVLFQGAIKQEVWVQALQGVRAPLGKVISRQVLSATYQSSVPGAPDGEYVIIQIQTSFENKKAAVETITPMREKDGQWRVSGYYIK